MFYPPFDVPRIGGGLLIGSVAIIHVVLAHFAVGAGIYNAVTETFARRRGDGLLLRFLYDNTRFLILFSFIAGAVSGVGIWFTISLVSPRATSALIHSFVWAWAIEWVFFAVEIASGYVYYYGWDRLSPQLHLLVGWIYAGSAWISLFIINGILTFMLSPPWPPEPGSFELWPALFNPTFLPSLLLRTVSALSLAAIFCCVVVNCSARYSRDERQHVINYSARFLLPLGLMAPLAWWYFEAVPEASRRLVFGGAVAMNLFFMFGLAASLLVAGYAYVGLIRMKRYVNLETSLLLAAVAFIATGSMEFVREGMRKPYVIAGYLWSNGIADRPRETGPLARDGVLAHAPWLTGPRGEAAPRDARQRGRLVYRSQCAACHVLGGVNDVAPLIATWTPDMIRRTLDELHARKPYMPPFVGRSEEADSLAQFLDAVRARGRAESGT